MKSLHNAVLGLAAAAALTFSVAAHQPATSNQQTQDKQGAQQMNSMIHGCGQAMQTMMQSNEQVRKDIEAAKQSNDPAKMRAALDQG